MTTLKEQIDYAKLERRRIAHRLFEQDELIRELESWRLACNHSFTKPIQGFEHEGGHCELCGINELFALSEKNRLTIKS